MTEFEKKLEKNMKAYESAKSHYDELDKEVRKRIDNIILDE